MTLTAAAAAGVGSQRELWYLSRASGAVCLLLFSAALVVGLLVRRGVDVGDLPRFWMVAWHRNLSLLATTFLAIHVVSALCDSYVNIGWLAALVPWTSAYERFWMTLGAVSLDLTLAAVVTSLVRGRLSARTWRAVHLTVYASWPIAVAHGIGSASDLQSGVQLGVTVVCCIAVAGAVAWRVRSASAEPPRAERVGLELARGGVR